MSICTDGILTQEQDAVYKHSLIYFLCKNKLKQLPSVTR